MNSQTKRPNYGLDAPGLVKTFLMGGGLAIAIGLTIPAFRSIANTGAWFVGTAGLMLWSSYFGKFKARDRLLRNLDLKGNELILDVGCGKGLLLIGAAKYLTEGKATGLDLWSQKDLSNNHKDETLKNAAHEGVLDKIEVIDGDMCAMPFASESYDKVIASMSIHNIPTREGRKKAIQEIAKVLKPGGQVALLDFQCTGEYTETLSQLGFQTVRRTPMSFWNFPPSRTVVAFKPTAQQF